MPSRSSLKLGFDTLEDRTLPSINGLTESLRILDPNNPDVVGITRSTQQNVNDALHTDSSVDAAWEFLSRRNGTDTHLDFQRGFNGNNYLVASGREAAPDRIQVQPKMWVEQVNATTVRIRYQDMPDGWRIVIDQGNIASRWTSDFDGQFTFTLPYYTNVRTAGVSLLSPGGAYTAVGQMNYRYGNIQSGSFGQANVPTWMSWLRSYPAREPEFLVAKNIDNSDAPNYGSVWHAGETLVRPGNAEDAIIRWTSPLKGTVTVDALLRDAQPNWGDGVTAKIELKNAQGTTVMATGTVSDGCSFHFLEGTPTINVDVGDTVSLVICAKGTTNDPANTTGDMTAVSMVMRNVETEKNFEHVNVVPRLNCELSADQRTIYVHYNNIDPNDDVRLAVSVPGQLPANGLKLWDASGTISINTSPYNKNQSYQMSLMRGQNEMLSQNFAAFSLPIGNSASDWTVSGLTTDTIRFPEFAHDALLAQDRAPSSDELEDQLSIVDIRNKALAVPAPRDWTDGRTFNWITVAQQNGVIVNQNVTGSGGTYLVAKASDTTKFTRLKAVSERSATITKLWYVTADGLKPLPNECYTTVGGYFIVKPNGPSTLVYEVKVDGTLQAGEGAKGDTMESVLPVFGQKVVGWIEKIDAQGGAYQGFGPMITEMAATANAVMNPGDTVHVITQLESMGTQSGALTVRVYCGYAGNTTDPLQRTFQTTMDPNQKKSLVFDVTSPTSTNPNARAVITFEVQYADGTKEILEQRITHGSQPRETMQFNPITHQYEWKVKPYNDSDYTRLARLTQSELDRSGIASTFMGDLRRESPAVFAKNDAEVAKVIADEFASRIATTLLDSQHLRDVVTGVYTIAMAGTSTESQFIQEMKTMTQLYQSVDPQSFNAVTALQDGISWFRDSDPNAITTNIGGINVRKDTMIGKLFAGVWQNALSLNDNMRSQMYAKVEALTGISRMTLMGISRTSDLTRFQNGLFQLFRNNGFGYLFTTGAGPFQRAEDMATLSSTDKVSYQHGRIRISWDLPSSMDPNNILRTDVFLMVHQGTGLYDQVGGTQSVPAAKANAGVFSVEIPVEQASTVLHGNNMAFKVVIWQKTMATDGLNQRKTEMTSDFTLDWDGTYDANSFGALKNTIPSNVFTDQKWQQILKDINVDTSNLDKGNAVLLQYLRKLLLESGELHYDTNVSSTGRSYELEGNSGDSGLKQCKEWLQDIVRAATQGQDFPVVELPLNDTSVSPNAFQWVLTAATKVKQVAQQAVGQDFKSMILSTDNAVKSGDIVQMNYKNITPHTFVISKIEADGVWVFDTNWGSKVYRVVAAGTGAYNLVNGQYVEAQSAAEKASANYSLQNDNTIRYHFFSFEDLHDKVVKSTVYRIQTA